MRGGLITAAMCSGTFGGGSTTAETMYDRISKLPTVFSFDIVDEWRGELCADSEPVGITPYNVYCRTDNWSEEYTCTVMPPMLNKVYYLRIFCGSELKLIADPQRYEAVSNYYECRNADVQIGKLKKTLAIQYSDFEVTGVAQYVESNLPYPPAVTLRYTLTTFENGEVTSTAKGGFSVISSSLKYFGNVDPNTYADFVKAVRKMSDEYNKTEEE